MALMAFKEIALRNSCIFVNVVFYETLQVLIFSIDGFSGYFWQMDLKKNHDFRVKISERSTLA